MRLSDLVRKGTQPGATPGPDGAKPAGESPAPGASGGATGATAAAGELAGRVSALLRQREEADGRPLKGLDAADLVFQKAVERLKEIHRTVKDAPLSIGQVEEAVEILLHSLKTSDALLVPFFRATGGPRSPAREAVNICIIAAKVGSELGYGQEELRQLALAALLCDIGMARVPSPIMGKLEPLTDGERAVLQNHQREGAKVLQALVPQHPWLGEVVLRRYTRTEAAAEPADRLDDHAAIIHLAATYDSLVNPRPPRERLGPLDALKYILQRQRTVFPERVLKGLIRAMSTFPVGSLVRLNTGDIGRVVARNKDLPLRPLVQILFRRGKRVEDHLLVDLSQSPLLYIKESVVEEGLP